MKSERFPYSKQQFMVNLLLLLMLIIILPLVLLSIQGVDFLLLAGMIGLVIVLIIVFSISPILTAHQLSNHEIVLKQGIYFKANIPLECIKSVRRIDSGPRRTGIWFKIFEKVLYVTTRRYDLVEIQLRSDQRFGWALWKTADRVVFDTLDNARFLHAMEERGITPSSPALRS
ncbi:MAG: hypothetical protein GKC03_06655 [Methanomassiliicoccales archaeon]|nr:hypothetical protein [Methanomassiliicoccales archaeon]NYT16173.1 hypothetical protein [Methanomassiliicoccales archaeon]